MKYDEAKVDEAVLALMYLTTFKDGMTEDVGHFRTWKSHDWEVMDRLHKKGFIGNPKSKVRSVDMTPEGEKRSRELFFHKFS